MSLPATMRDAWTGAARPSDDAAAAKADAVFRQIPRRDALKQRRHRADELLRTVIGGLPFSGIYPLLGGAGGVREF